MTKKNVLILSSLRKLLRTPKTKRVLMIVVRSQSIVRINLSILNILLNEMREKGIYLTIESPDKHVMNILKKHEVAEDSGTEFGKRKKLIIAAGIKKPLIFFKEIFRRASTGDKNLDDEIRSMNFLLIDNLSAMGNYNSSETVKEIFGAMEEFLKRYDNIQIIIVTDKKVYPEVHEIAKKYSNEILELPDEWFAP